MTTFIGNDTPVVGGVADSSGCTNTSGGPDAYQATAAITGTVDTLHFFETTIADSAITGVWIGIFADSSNTPGAHIGSGFASGRPPANTWVSASGLSIPVTAGTKYWLAILPNTNFTGGQNISFNDGNDGSTLLKFTTATTYTTLSAASNVAWSTSSVTGPMDIYGSGTVAGTDLNVVLIN